MNFSFYHFTGFVSALFVVLALGGLFAQAKFIHQRTAQFRRGALAEQPTAVLSLNRFFVAYFAFYSIFSYGLFLQPLNYYLVAPRVLAAFILLYILYAIMRDRKTLAAQIVFYLSVSMFVGALFVRWLGFLQYSVNFAQILIVIASAGMLQGAAHQIIRIRSECKTGGLSLVMHQMFFAKDFFSCLFGVALGFQLGWPLLLLNGISLVVQVVTIYHFRWCRIQAANLRAPS